MLEELDELVTAESSREDAGFTRSERLEKTFLDECSASVEPIRRATAQEGSRRPGDPAEMQR